MTVIRTHPTQLLIDGAEVAYTDSGGEGEPLLLIHGGGLADWLTPLAETPALKHYRVIRMVRAGYTDTPLPRCLGIADHARHAASLLRQLNAAPAHVVAHSSGSAIALQLAVDDPPSVRTITLCEPPLVDALADPSDLEDLHAALGPMMESAIAATARGNHSEAFDAFMTVICGPGYRSVMETALGAGLVNDAAHRSEDFFTNEIPAVSAWTFDPAVACPVLLVQGADSPPAVARLIANVAGQLPDSTVVTVADAGHLMPLTAPAELGGLIEHFCRPR